MVPLLLPLNSSTTATCNGSRGTSSNTTTTYNGNIRKSNSGPRFPATELIN